VFVLGPVLAVLYGGGVRRLGRRGRAWPVRRSLAFGAGVVALASSELVPETSFVGHRAGHVLLGMVALYLSPLIPLSLRNPVVHATVHLHFLAAGCLFIWPLVGADPLPRPVPYGARILAVLAAVPFHAFLGLALLSTRAPLAPAVYPSLPDQHAAAGLLWASGELMTLVAAVIVLRVWMTPTNVTPPGSTSGSRCRRSRPRNRISNGAARGRAGSALR